MPEEEKLTTFHLYYGDIVAPKKVSFKGKTAHTFVDNMIIEYFIDNKPVFSVNHRYFISADTGEGTV